jgi:hypothetical protein
MMQRETVSGNGPWQVIYYDGVALRVELETEGRTLIVTQRAFDSICPRCGKPIKATTPENVDLDYCAQCENAIERENRG